MPASTSQATGHEHDGIADNPSSGIRANENPLMSLSVSSLEAGDNGIVSKEGTSTKQYRAPIARRITARSPNLQPSPVYSLRSQVSSLRLDCQEDEEDKDLTITSKPSEQALFSQVLNWLHQEQSKHRNGGGGDGLFTTGVNGRLHVEEKRHSLGSEKGLALDQLEAILEHYAATAREQTHSLQRRRSKKHRHSRLKGLRRGSGSDSEYFDDTVVPSVDAVLDNTKTLGYTSGSSTDHLTLSSEPQSRNVKENAHWLTFKSEILRLTHTLRLKGWRKVPVEDSADIEVTRLSGALTNAVYVVKPPRPSPPTPNADGTAVRAPRRPPPKLLLRIYGPQVEHLIDREAELQVLRRLGRKHIGPRVLGTFTNGRFEEFFNAQPLTPQELRNPETSRHIAKRMRELHDGVELLEEERQGGPTVFRNWDNWVDRCEQVISWLDKEILLDRRDCSEPWRRRGLVCGVPWATFRKAVENYRIWLIDHLGGIKEVKQQLVFAHNDTQYGNLLRLEPEEESPLLLPSNSHKQLVVIDFEYSSANVPGLEFANHFTEWCYNYHDPERPWACNTRAYPTPEEQYRFISAYVYHGRPQPSQNGSNGIATSPLTTPDITPSSIPTPRLAPFSLDAPALSVTSSLSASDAPDRIVYEEAYEAEIQHHLRQTRLWRVANSAQWVAWGIVQAKVPAMEEEEDDDEKKNPEKHATTVVVADHDNDKSERSAVEETDSESEFDYLAYAQDRALFFWADVLAMGLVRENELPSELLKIVKTRILNY